MAIHLMFFKKIHCLNCNNSLKMLFQINCINISVTSDLKLKKEEKKHVKQLYMVK